MALWVLGLTAGGILGGLWSPPGHGLKKWLWPMALSIIIPSLVYLYMAMVRA